MASGKSEFLELQFLDWVLGKSNAWVPPDTVYIALSTNLFDDSLAGDALAEPVGGDYARVAVPNDVANWPAATRPSAGAPGAKTNLLTIPFPTPTADWGNAKSAYICDALTGGNQLAGGDLSVPKTISTGDATAFAPGTLVWAED